MLNGEWLFFSNRQECFIEISSESLIGKEKLDQRLAWHDCWANCSVNNSTLVFHQFRWTNLFHLYQELDDIGKLIVNRSRIFLRSKNKNQIKEIVDQYSAREGESSNRSIYPLCPSWQPPNNNLPFLPLASSQRISHYLTCYQKLRTFFFSAH